MAATAPDREHTVAEVAKACEALRQAMLECTGLKGRLAFIMLTEALDRLTTTWTNSAWLVKDPNAETYKEKYEDLMEKDVRELAEVASKTIAVVNRMVKK